MSKLTTSDRNSLPSKDFALPGKGSGSEGKGSGAYPIPDASHARNALARSSGKPEASTVRAKVAAKFPNIGKEPNGSATGGPWKHGGSADGN